MQLRQTTETKCCAFERNFDFCTKMSPPSDYDWGKQFSPPVSVTPSEFSPESSDGQNENEFVKPEFVADEENSEEEPPKVEEVEVNEEQQPLFPLFLCRLGWSS